MTARALLICVILTATPFICARAEPPPDVHAEIDYLLQYVETSGCAFYRNGVWYESARATAHLRTKYDYLAARKLIVTTEDFIEKAATKSSMSGLPYKIRCGTGDEIASADWLRQALASYRASRQD